MKNQKSKEPKAQAPITDGDARPDQFPAAPKKNLHKKNKTTSARNADSNTLEDYKDAK